MGCNFIGDGKGKGNLARVDVNNRLHVHSVTEQESYHSVVTGNAYNINTGKISFSTNGTLVYLKNTEDRDLVIESIAVGIGKTGTHSDTPEITIVRNPTGGDLISDASAVDMNVNRNFGSSKTLSANAYKGKSGGTVTGGVDGALFFQVNNGRLFAGVNLSIPKGQSIAVKFEPNLSSGSVFAYGALICYLKDEASKD